MAPMTGVASAVNGIPDRSHLVNTQNLIQAGTSEGNEAQEYGQVINMWVASGAGPVWGANIDVVQHESVGDKELMGLEINYSNFNRDFLVGGAVSAALGIQPLTSYRVTAGIYMAGISAITASNPGGHMMYDAILVNGKTSPRTMWSMKAPPRFWAATRGRA